MEAIRSNWQAAWTWLNVGWRPYAFILGWLAVMTVWVYNAPRDVVPFVLFLCTGLLLHFSKVPRWAQAVIGVVMVVGIMPVLGLRNIAYLEVAFQISLFAALALGLNIVVGFAGLLDLGYVAFYAVGAYLWGFFGSRQPYLLNAIPGTMPPDTPFFLPADAFWLFLFLAVIAAAIAGIMLGLPVLRLRGDYLAIVTLGFGEVIRVLANNFDKPLNITNGPQGITPIQKPSLPPNTLDFLNERLAPIVGQPISESQAYNLFFYLLAVLVIVVVVFVAVRLENSRIGRAWTAIREDEMAAIAMGIPLVRMKLAAFAAGASFAGAMGVLVASSRNFVSPETFSFMQSIGVLSMVILGGLGSIPGVILGAAVVVVLNTQLLQNLSLALNQLRQSNEVIPLINFAWRDLSTQLDPAKYQRLLFGLILIFMMIFRPAGLIPAKRRQVELTGKED